LALSNPGTGEQGTPPPVAQGITAVLRWLSDDDLKGLYTASYWNDIEEERKKPWWIENGEYDQCRRYLTETGLMGEYQLAEAFIRDMPRAGLRVADLAAGIGWTSALLSKLEGIAEVHCVEMSSHRLERLFPHSLAMCQGNSAKIHRYLGSFYDLRLPDQSMDVVFLSQAFHHAHRPIRLITECDRILKPGGRIVLVGEHRIRAHRVASRFLSTLLRTGRIVTNFHDLFPPDAALGDHYYRRSDYYLLFRAMGYQLRHRAAPTGNMLYVADKGV
jgi:ubiquinone/menaquinone biosynthesis C-methylase UbiE